MYFIYIYMYVCGCRRRYLCVQIRRLKTILTVESLDHAGNAWRATGTPEKLDLYFPPGPVRAAFALLPLHSDQPEASSNLLRLSVWKGQTRVPCSIRIWKPPVVGGNLSLHQFWLSERGLESRLWNQTSHLPNSTASVFTSVKWASILRPSSWGYWEDPTEQYRVCSATDVSVFPIKAKKQ